MANNALRHTVGVAKAVTWICRDDGDAFTTTAVMMRDPAQGGGKALIPITTYVDATIINREDIRHSCGSNDLVPTDGAGNIIKPTIAA